MYDPRRSGFRRDHTDLFNELRRSSPAQPLTRPTTDSNVITVISDDVNVKLSILERKLSDLDDLFTQRGRLTFDNSQLESLDRQIGQITADISQRVSQLNLETKQPLPVHDPAVVPLLVNLRQSHRLRLASLVQRFRGLQATKRRDMQPPEEPDDPISAMYADFHPSVTPDQALLMEQDEELAREQTELARLVGMMNELNTMFRDLSLVIFEQGTILDRIDTRIDMAVQDVQAGNEDLEAANRHQKRGCFRSYIIVIMVLIGICLLIMVFRKR
jgi:syntaxin 16